MSSDPAVRVEHLSKCYHVYQNPLDRLKQPVMSRIRRLFGRAPKQYFTEFWALQDISLEVQKGETVGIIGRNGSGKSTLLQLICGTLHPTAGQVETQGRVAALLELGSGFNPEFTGRENVYMNAAILGLSRDEIQDRYKDIITFADIGDYVDQPVKSYSSGMMVRLAFAVIAHVDADILVIDEALAVGDIFFQQKCLRFLKSFQQAGGTILFVSHDTSAVSAMCDRAVLLSKSREKQFLAGPTEKICRAYLSDLYEEKSRNYAPGDQQERTHTGPKNQPLNHADRASPDISLKGKEPLENSISVSKFLPDAESMGLGGMEISDIWFQDLQGQRLSDLSGGAWVVLAIQARAFQRITDPVFGFMLKDRLGQYIFAEGTDPDFSGADLILEAGDVAVASFSFRMPILIRGEYTLNVAAASGKGDDHVQHHWVHDALVVRSLRSRLVHGIVGLQELKKSLDIFRKT